MTQDQEGQVARPFLKWAGGKGRLLDQYAAYFPRQYRTYFEPFLGGGAVFFHLRPQQAVLTDINPHLVNIYRCVRDQVEFLIPLLQDHQAQHGPDYYYRIRALQPEDPVHQAARLLYLNKTCFNGLYRENASGQFNVPIGRYRNPRICDPTLLRAASQALQGSDLQVQPFEAILEAATPADFVYFDPPYHPLSATSSFTAYNRHSFGEADQIRLQDVFATLAARGVPVMLSNSDCQWIRTLYQDFPVHTITAARAINSKAQRRGKITEVLVTSA
ncbi:MAG: DNA adenine methylase [Synechococcaceae cyanobacterium SM2_3_1]|nr:DNA adenine methylase [Synechococcaceae cyanobacterium SM2_3_1]